MVRAVLFLFLVLSNVKPFKRFKHSASAPENSLTSYTHKPEAPSVLLGGEFGRQLIAHSIRALVASSGVALPLKISMASPLLSVLTIYYYCIGF